MVEFATFSKEESDTVVEIARRAKEAGIYKKFIDAEMDISATHAKCPLALDRLLAFPDFDFAHDMAGIQNHLNRETGQLENLFLPRCAKPQ